MELNTVIVIEYFDNTIQSVHVFPDNNDGNRKAEKLFVKIAMENLFNDEDIEIGLENGLLESDVKDYQLFIIHS